MERESMTSVESKPSQGAQPSASGMGGGPANDDVVKRASRILIFTGDGKGKTTAALGMALRAVGHGQRVSFVQFLKNDATTGELAAARHLPGMSIEQAGLGFVPSPTHVAYAAHRQAAQAALARVEQVLDSGAADLVVLDEVCVAISKQLLDVATVLRVLGHARAGTNIVLTGRGASAELMEAADTVTSMTCVKHAMQAGRGADAGVEW